MIDMPVALSILGVCGTITAAILKCVPKRNGKVNGYYVTTREYDAYKRDLGDSLVEIKTKLNSLDNYVRSKLC